MWHMNYETILNKSSRSVCISSIVDYIITLKNEIATKQHKADKRIIFCNFLNWATYTIIFQIDFLPNFEANSHKFRNLSTRPRRMQNNFFLCGKLFYHFFWKATEHFKGTYTWKFPISLLFGNYLEMSSPEGHWGWTPSCTIRVWGNTSCSMVTYNFREGSTITIGPPQDLKHYMKGCGEVQVRGLWCVLRKGYFLLETRGYFFVDFLFSP